VRTYHAEVDRDGRYWHIRVPEVQRSTQARNLGEVDDMGRDLIALMEDVPADSFEFEWRLNLPDDIRTQLEHARTLREQAAREQAEAARLSRDAAQRLRARGLTLRDIGKALGVTFQRAKQLLDDTRSHDAGTPAA
jgi:hypothetical protein